MKWFAVRRRFSDATLQPPQEGPDRPGGTISVHANDLGPISNKLLNALPQSDFQLLHPRLTTIHLAQSTVLYESGNEVMRCIFRSQARMIEQHLIVSNSEFDNWLARHRSRS